MAAILRDRINDLLTANADLEREVAKLRYADAGEDSFGKGAKKKRKKKLTSVSFAFTHTYIPVKTYIFPFFPKRTWKILKNAHKRKN